MATKPKPNPPVENFDDYCDVEERIVEHALVVRGKKFPIHLLPQSEKARVCSTGHTLKGGEAVFTAKRTATGPWTIAGDVSFPERPGPNPPPAIFLDLTEKGLVGDE